jgi:hypothetical protein
MLIEFWSTRRRVHASPMPRRTAAVHEVRSGRADSRGHDLRVHDQQINRPNFLGTSR